MCLRDWQDSQNEEKTHDEPTRIRRVQRARHAEGIVNDVLSYIDISEDFVLATYGDLSTASTSRH